MSAATKIGLLEIPPLSFAFLRFLIASLIIIPFALKAKKKISRDFIKIAPLSIFAVLNIAFFTVGVKTTTATISQILYAGVPLLTALFSYVFMAERLNFRKTAGILLGFIGVVAVVFLPVFESGKAFSGDLRGNMLITGGVICWSFYMVFSKKLQRNHSPFEIVSIFIILTTLVLLPFFLLELKTNYGWWDKVEIHGLISMFYVTVVGTIFAYLLSQYAIKHGGSVFASTAFYLQPIFGFLSAFIVLGEKLTLGIVIGGSLALLGVFFVTKK